MKPILEIKNISKKYKINKNGAPGYLSFRDSITDLFKPKASSNEEFWALNDISFEVYPGESIGIIGKNGAGKSTLLKILSRITPPTSGKIISRGRIASLLEVGTGFHPELTGKENIFLNGSILGLKRHEILRQFDSIVDFSGVEKFLNTPLKHYSSGMQLRLAFAVSAHLEPEILIIDEVLAVGDVEFQKKCMGKMDEVSKSGRTILFVSHNMGSLKQLCERLVWLESGRMVDEGGSDKMIGKYLESLNKRQDTGKNKNTSNKNYIALAETIGEDNGYRDVFGHREVIKFRLNLNIKEIDPDLKITAEVKDVNGKVVFLTESKVNCAGLVESLVELPAGVLTPGKYYFTSTLHITNMVMFDREEYSNYFEIIDQGSPYSIYGQRDIGYVYLDCKWENKIKH